MIDWYIGAALAATIERPRSMQHMDDQIRTTLAHGSVARLGHGSFVYQQSVRRDLKR